MRAINLFFVVGISFLCGSMATYILTGGEPKLHNPKWFHLPAWSSAPAAKAATPAAPPPPIPKVPGTIFEPDPYAGATRNDQPEPLVLPQAGEVGEIIDLLRGRFIDAAALMNTDLNENTLSGVLQKYPGKIKISEGSVLSADPKQKSILEVLPDGIGYWRPADFSQREIESFLKGWTLWKSGQLNGMILDLRQFRDANNLQGAAMVAGLFVSPQTNLFSVDGLNMPQKVFQAQHQPLGLPAQFPMVILINGNTRGAAEALALALQIKAGTLLAGRKTAGEGGLFTESRLKSGRYLRMATARLVGADGETLLDRILVPDIAVDVSAPADRDGFNAAYQSGVQALAVVRSQSHTVLKAKEDLDLPLDNTDPLLEPKAPRDLVLNVAHDVILGITAAHKKIQEAATGVRGG